MSAAGGKALVEKYGVKHMAEIGRRGAAMFYQRYKWIPAGTSGWALVRKSDDVIIRTVGVRPF